MAEKRITRRHVQARLLLEGIQRSDSELWAIATEERGTIETFFRETNLVYVLDEALGIAYLRNPTTEEEDVAVALGEAPLPRVIRSQPLGYWPSLLAALLRERLHLHEESDEGGHPFIVEEGVLFELFRPHIPEVDDEKVAIKKLKESISRLEDLAIVRKVPNRAEAIYRVEPMIKARITVGELQSFLEQLKGSSEEKDEPGEQSS
ncbi:MAG TPA: DUF4194 domain-containing protein [Opitutaceae bacterium]